MATADKESGLGPAAEKMRKISWERILMMAGIILIAANLRAPITSVGPVIKEITRELSLSHVLVALITSIPLISFALLSTFAPAVARKAGLERLLFYSLLILGAGLLARSTGYISLLFAGAAMIGAAITVGNVLMPAFIKKEFPAKVGLVTGIYLVAMNLVSALAAGYSIRLGKLTGLGWKGSTGIWVVFTIIALIAWLPQLRKKPLPYSAERARTGRQIWRSRLAWQISLLMGIQSFLFYSFAAWLPAMLQDWGLSADDSGWMFSYIQMAQLPVMLLGPIAADKMKDQTPLVWITFVLLILGLSGILIFGTTYIVLSVLLIGASLGLAFTLSMMFFVLRTRNPGDAADLSGMAQTVGYLIAAAGPPVFGGLYSLSGAWYLPLALLVGIAIALLITGLESAKDRTI